MSLIEFAKADGSLVPVSPTNPLPTTGGGGGGGTVDTSNLATSAKQDAAQTTLAAIAASTAAAATSAKQDAALARMPALVNGRTPVDAATDVRAAAGAAVIAPNDAANLATTPRAVYVGTAGHLAVVLSGTTVTFKNVPAGSLLPIAPTRVLATGTTAVDLVALL